MVQIRFDVFLNALEPCSGEAAAQLHGFGRRDTVAPLQVDCESISQRLAKEFAGGGPSVEVSFERAQDVFDLPILHAPLVHQFYVSAGVMLL